MLKIGFSRLIFCVVFFIENDKMVKELNGIISFKEIEIYYKGIDERVWFLFNDIEKVLNKLELYEKEKLVLINKK